MVAQQQNKSVPVKPPPKSYGRIVLTLHNCLLPDSAFEKTPSMTDGLDVETETDLRILGCELIQTAGILLKLPQVAMATGQVYLQRFYYSKSFVRFPMEMMAMGSVYLASKVEEKPCRIRDVINVFHHIKQVRAQKPITPLLVDQNYVDLKNQVIKAERRVLKELGFCVHVKHPHKLIVVYLQLLTYEKNNQLMQLSWNYMNDALRTNVFMRYHPETIACACIYLSARKIGLPLPNNPHWFSLFTVKEEDIRDVCFSILRLYKRTKVNSEELEKKVDTLRHIYQANKLLNSQSNQTFKSDSSKKDSPHTRDEKRDKFKSTTPPLKHHSRKRRSRSPYERKERGYKKYRSRSNSPGRRERDRSRDRREERRNRGYTSSSSGTSRKYEEYERSKARDRDDKRCCGWCSALRPRYKRLVDNIFPATPQEGLVKANMEKLTFYSLSSPEKLDRIGEYLFQRASRDIYRKRNGFVIIAMEAMDQLLVACHAQTLNLFVESYLKMVQKLLESLDPQLQILATQSFVRFANIEEDTPSYHRRYDFFVSKFSAMCHSNHTDRHIRDSIRLAGIKGLQGVVRKTVSDDLVENIWESQHMDKIVPSLLYNMQNAECYTTETAYPTLRREGRLWHFTGGEEEPFPSAERAPANADEPPRLAEACLRELIGRASFGHIRSVLRPVLRHFDLHELWVPNDFAIHTFRIIMFSIQAQYSYTVIEALMTHLDDDKVAKIGKNRTLGTNINSGMTQTTTKVRAAVAQVLSKIIAIPAGDSVGPSVLEIINNLLTHLKASVNRDSEKETDEKQYQEALINALAEFADHLPDYQKIDIMMFIVSNVPGASHSGNTASIRSSKTGLKSSDTMLQTILLKSLLKVGSTYTCTSLSKALPAAFLEALLRLSRAPQPSARANLQRLLHSLIDRHHNRKMLSVMTANVNDLGLNLALSRPDLIFINKHGPAIYNSLYEGLQIESNTVENVETIYTTLALLCVELASEETICDMLQFVMAIQQAALQSPILTRAQRYHLHSLAVALLALVPHVQHPALPKLDEYVKKIIEARQNDAPHLLPSISDEYEELPSPSKMPYLLIDQMALCEVLAASGLDVAHLQGPSPYTGTTVTSRAMHRHSWVETGAVLGRDSLADITTGHNTDVDSEKSSPGVQRKAVFMEEEVELEELRRAAAAPGDAERRDAEQKRLQLGRAFRTATFRELKTITQPKHDLLQNKLAEIFQSLAEGQVESPTSPVPLSPSASQNQLSKVHRLKMAQPFQTTIPAYEKHFPELFLY